MTQEFGMTLHDGSWLGPHKDIALGRSCKGLPQVKGSCYPDHVCEGLCCVVVRSCEVMMSVYTALLGWHMVVWTPGSVSVRSGHPTLHCCCCLLLPLCFAGISHCSQQSVASWYSRGSHVAHTQEVGHNIVQAFPDRNISQ